MSDRYDDARREEEGSGFRSRRRASNGRDEREREDFDRDADRRERESSSRDSDRREREDFDRDSGKGKGKGKGGRGESRGKKNKDLGRRGEDAAACYLERRGYEILERNWKCVAGEADLVVSDGEYLVFVEVKTRSDTEKGFPAEAVDARKRDKYERIAAIYLQECPIADMRVRFDVVSIIAYGSDRAFIRHHINAFS